MNKPNGIDLMRTLVELLADQEGCRIYYQVVSETNHTEE